MYRISTVDSMFCIVIGMLIFLGYLFGLGKAIVTLSEDADGEIVSFRIQWGGFLSIRGHGWRLTTDPYYYYDFDGVEI